MKIATLPVPYDESEFHECSGSGRVSSDPSLVTDRVFCHAAGQDVEVTHRGNLQGQTVMVGITATGKQVVFPKSSLGKRPEPCQRTHMGK